MRTRECWDRPQGAPCQRQGAPCKWSLTVCTLSPTVCTLLGVCTLSVTSTQIGFVAQLKGTLTKRRYTAATVFVDHYSRLQNFYLMESLTSEETIKAKRAFERFLAKHGVRIRQYHTNNSRFADNAFVEACAAAGQRLTFCGVNAHFQNGITERAIRSLSVGARKQLLHAKERWPTVVHLALWPYALRCAALQHNTLPILDDGTSRLELFSGVRCGAKLRHMHVFGCPVFALNNVLASGNTVPRWSPRACLGLNLVGLSPSHARNINLVLLLMTGLVSPQFHCTFDDFFETTKPEGTDIHVGSTWHQLAGLVRASRY
jgi:hypothetical protein